MNGVRFIRIVTICNQRRSRPHGGCVVAVAVDAAVAGRRDGARSTLGGKRC